MWLQLLYKNKVLVELDMPSDLDSTLNALTRSPCACADNNFEYWKPKVSDPQFIALMDKLGFHYQDDNLSFLLKAQWRTSNVREIKFPKDMAYGGRSRPRSVFFGR